MILRAPTYSRKVAARLQKGESLFDAIHGVLGGLPPDARPKTSDVLSDLEQQGVWTPQPVGQRVA